MLRLPSALRWCGALLAVAALVLTACGGRPTDETTRPTITSTNPYGGDPATEGTPKRGGMLASAPTARPSGSTRPCRTPTRPRSRSTTRCMKLKPDGSAEPYMAESMDSPDGGQTWRLGLRDGVTFTDGTPLDAHAVIVNVQRHIDKVSSPGHRFTEPIESMRAVDPLTVEFRLKSPFGLFPMAFAGSFTTGSLGTIISPAALQQYGDQIANNPVGAGPFVLGNWTRDSRMVLTRNPNYWQEGMPYLDGLEFRPLPDTETRYASIENGDVDLIFGGYHTELLRGSRTRT